jgi:dienelactone hydrolase
LAAVLCALGALASAQDSRNTNIPNTDTHFTMREYKSVAEWEARKAQLRTQILSAAGLLPMPARTKLNPIIIGRKERGDYIIENVALETMPGYYLGGNLYRPRGRNGKFPAVLLPHGHWIYGRLENQQLDSTPLQGINLARQGYIAFAYDMVGYNDTNQTGHEFDEKPERLWSFGPFGLQTWNSIRALDFLESLPEVDGKRIGVTGASGGASQAMYLAAVDDRIAFSAPVNMISAIMQGGSHCENAPGLRIGTNNMELAAMMAPKPMLAVAATGDWTKNLPREEYPAIRRIWALYDKEANVQAVQFDSPHNYHHDSREAVYAFFGKHVLGLGDPPKEREADVEKLQDMLVFFARTRPSNALTYDQIFDHWKHMARRQFESEKDKDALRARMRLVFAAEWPEKVDMTPDGALTRPGIGDRVPAQWTPGNGNPVLYLHPDGVLAAAKSDAVRKLLAEKRPVLLIDAFQTGSAKAPRDRNHPHFLTFNVTDDAARVQDVLTAIRYLQANGSKIVEISGEGDALVWAMFAAALSPGEVRLAATPAFRGTVQEYIDRFYVPGIQRVGGLEAARRLIAGRN